MSPPFYSVLSNKHLKKLQEILDRQIPSGYSGLELFAANLDQAILQYIDDEREVKRRPSKTQMKADIQAMMKKLPPVIEHIEAAVHSTNGQILGALQVDLGIQNPSRFQRGLVHDLKLFLRAVEFCESHGQSTAYGRHMLAYRIAQCMEADLHQTPTASENGLLEELLKFSVQTVAGGRSHDWKKSLLCAVDIAKQEV